jgi:hypothetical protein
VLPRRFRWLVADMTVWHSVLLEERLPAQLTPSESWCRAYASLTPSVRAAFGAAVVAELRSAGRAWEWERLRASGRPGPATN